MLLGKFEIDYREHRALCSDVELECMGEVGYYSSLLKLVPYLDLIFYGTRSMLLTFQMIFCALIMHCTYHSRDFLIIIVFTKEK